MCLSLDAVDANRTFRMVTYVSSSTGEYLEIQLAKYPSTVLLESNRSYL